MESVEERIKRLNSDRCKNYRRRKKELEQKQTSEFNLGKKNKNKNLNQIKKSVNYID